MIFIQVIVWSAELLLQQEVSSPCIGTFSWKFCSVILCAIAVIALITQELGVKHKACRYNAALL